MAQNTLVIGDPGHWVVDENGAPVGMTSSSGAQTSFARLSADGTELMDANGNPFAMLPLDANGNVLANIGMRQNTLANLLALDGVPGEISVATDVDALVVHNGQAGQARAYSRSAVRDIAIGYGTSNLNVLNSTETVVPLTATIRDQLGLFDLTNEEIVLPADAGDYRWLFKAHSQINQYNSASAGPDANTEILINMEMWSGSGFGPVARIARLKAPAFTYVPGPLPISWEYSGAFQAGTRLRFVAWCGGAPTGMRLSFFRIHVECLYKT